VNSQMIKKIQAMQREIQQAQRDIEETLFTISSGAVTVVIYGNHEVKEVKIDPTFEVQGPDDLELLGDMFVAASHKANEEIAQYTEEKLSKYKAFMGGF